MNEAIDRRMEQLIGLLFLGGMVVTLILAVWTFQGTPTIILLITSLVFLAVARFFLAGDTNSEQGANPAHAGQGAPSAGDASGVFVVCPDCEHRAPERAKFCPECGAELGA